MPDITPGDLASEWKRSNPDIVVYLPKGGDLNDTDNEHFLVFEAPKSDELLVMWTQSSCEGRGDNHLVLARSSDGGNWSEPNLIVGTTPGGSEKQAGWGFPIVADIFRGHFFIDTGNLAETPGWFSIDEYRVSVGVGVRIKVPIFPAPIELDFGYPLRRENMDEKRVFSFFVGFPLSP